VVEDEAALTVEDEAALTEAGVPGLIEETGATDHYLMLPVVTVAKIAKFLLDPQTVNLFIAVTVLKKWAMAEETVQEDRTKEAVVPLKPDPIWGLLMQSLTKS